MKDNIFESLKNLFGVGEGNKEDLTANLSDPNINNNVFDDTSYIEDLLDEQINIAGNAPCLGNACKGFYGNGSL